MGTLPGFEVVPEELQAAAAQLSRVGSEARSDLARLGADVATLLDGGWHGQAAVVFQRGWTQWFAGADEVLDALLAMARLLGATGQGYDCAEAASTLSGVGGQV